MVRSRRRTEPIKEQNFVTTEEWLNLLDATALVNWPPWRVDRVLILLTLLYCGLLRISETVIVRAEDITEEEQAWKCQIRRAKNDQFGSGTAVYLAEEPWFDDVLRRHKLLRRSGQLLSTDTGRRWSEAAATSEIRRLCEAANIRTLSPHAFRRGGTMRALESGVSVDSVQRRGRWASTKSMRPYVNCSLITQGGPASLIK
ncbi:site-specific recombinase, phage integrase family [Ancylostoma duodenale]|uniref:Site-specific recombinase, phage integrase family n=1 Tax=Ancylostoma duodenale TaxID=51022 RepID=A0A0C2DEP0_9BILA|nr:site-specific recombinase, phage integrase family [Ancylostoma duodenale]